MSAYISGTPTGGRAVPQSRWNTLLQMALTPPKASDLHHSNAWSCGQLHLPQRTTYLKRSAACWRSTSHDTSPASIRPCNHLPTAAHAGTAQTNHPQGRAPIANLRQAHVTMLAAVRNRNAIAPSPHIPTSCPCIAHSHHACPFQALNPSLLPPIVWYPAWPGPRTTLLQVQQLQQPS